MTLTDSDPLVSTSLFSSRTPPGRENKAIAATFSRSLYIWMAKTAPALSLSISPPPLAVHQSCHSSAISQPRSRRDHISSSLHNSTRLFALCRRKTTSSFGRNDALTDWDGWLAIRLRCCGRSEIYSRHDRLVGSNLSAIRRRDALFGYFPWASTTPALPLRKVYYIYTTPPAWIVGLRNSKRTVQVCKFSECFCECVGNFFFQFHRAF